MNLEKYLVVAGLPGVHKLVSTRSNGFIIDDRNEGRTRFVAARQNPVTLIATVGIYVEQEDGQDTIPLPDVFQKMLDAVETIPPVSANASAAELRAYFTAVLPNHDQDRVHNNDIKKCVKWFTYMLEKGIFEEARREAEAAAAAAETPAE